MLFHQHTRGDVVVVEKTYLPLGRFHRPRHVAGRDSLSLFWDWAKTPEVADVADFHCSIRFCLGLGGFVCFDGVLVPCK